MRTPSKKLTVLAASALLSLIPDQSVAADTPVTSAKQPGRPGASKVLPAEQLSIPFRPIITCDDNGSRCAPIDGSIISKWVDQANQAYSTAGIEFAFDGRPESVTKIRNSLINNFMPGCYKGRSKQKKEAMRVANKYSGELVTFFRYGSKKNSTGSGFSSSRSSYVIMPGKHTRRCGKRNDSLLAHEIGHYLGIRHTFSRQFKTVEQAEKYFIKKGRDPSIFDGDKLDDTPVDPSIAEIKCNKDQYEVTLDGVTFPIARDNIMSYMNTDRETLSPSQVKKVRKKLKEKLSGRKKLEKLKPIAKKSHEKSHEKNPPEEDNSIGIRMLAGMQAGGMFSPGFNLQKLALNTSLELVSSKSPLNLFSRLGFSQSYFHKKKGVNLRGENLSSANLQLGANARIVQLSGFLERYFDPGVTSMGFTMGLGILNSPGPVMLSGQVGFGTFNVDGRKDWHPNGAVLLNLQFATPFFGDGYDLENWHSFPHISPH